MKFYAEGLLQRVVDDIVVAAVVAPHKLVVVAAAAVGDDDAVVVVDVASIFELHRLHVVAAVENKPPIVAAIVAFQLKRLKRICNKIKNLRFRFTTL